MVYNEKMDKNLDEIVSNWKNSIKKKMFGGIGYLLNGNMVAGIHKYYNVFRFFLCDRIILCTKPQRLYFDSSRLDV